MSRTDYEAFKERMKEWMSDHADAYDAFEEMMNYESDEGYRLVMTTAMKLLPKFAKAAAKQMSTRGEIDVDAVIAQCSGSNLAQTIIAKFDKNTSDANATLPAMICGLYFGRSFENMVERGEELSKHSKLVGIENFFLARMIKMVVKKSIELGLRTREDWDEYYELKKIIEEGHVVAWALRADDDNSRPPQPLDKAERPSTLESMILLDDEKKQALLDKIKQYIHSGVKGKRIALMILALRRLGYLPDITSSRQLFVALKSHYGTYIGSDKSIYAYLDDKVAAQFDADINDLAAYFKVD